MKILFLHGLESLPGGSKVEYLRGLGHDVLNPLLPKDDFEESVRIAQEEVDLEAPDLIVGSSRGGAIAMAIDPGRARLILIAPAWKHFEVPASAPANTDVLHCTTDDKVLFQDSQKLQGANLVPCGDSHRMDDEVALAALGRAVKGNLQTEALLRGYVRGLLESPSFEWTPEMKEKWAGMMDDERRNVERSHGAGLMNPDVVYDQLNQTMQANMHAGETYLDFVYDAIDHENWPAAVNAISEALWIDDVPAAADEALKVLLMDIQNEDDLTGAVAEWVPRYWKVNAHGRIMGRK